MQTLFIVYLAKYGQEIVRKSISRSYQSISTQYSGRKGANDERRLTVVSHNNHLVGLLTLINVNLKGGFTQSVFKDSISRIGPCEHKQNDLSTFI